MPGHAVGQLVEALPYKSEGRGSNSRRCHWNFSLIKWFRPRYYPGDDSASNRNEYQEYFLGGKSGRCVGLTNLPLSFADCLESWEPQPSETLQACNGIALLFIEVNSIIISAIHSAIAEVYEGGKEP